MSRKPAPQPVTDIRNWMPEEGESPMTRLEAAFDNLVTMTEALLTANVEEMDAEEVYTQAKLTAYASGLKGSNEKERDAFLAASISEQKTALDRAANTRKHYAEKQMLAKEALGLEKIRCRALTALLTPQG